MSRHDHPVGGREPQPGEDRGGPPGNGSAPSEASRQGADHSRDLGSRALASGFYLAAREAGGITVRLGGVLAVTRIIGPALFGDYAAAAAFAGVVASVAQMGVEVSLLRQPGPVERRSYDQAFTFLLISSVVCGTAALGASVVIGSFAPNLLGPRDIMGPFRLLLVSVPLNVLWAPAQARIERAFGYKGLAWLELGGDVVLYVTAVPLALAGLGAFSLVLGFIAYRAVLLIGGYWLAGFFPRLAWSTAAARALLSRGASYSVSPWMERLSGLANPLVVGHFFGAAGVGYVALAQRLVDALSFGQRAAWRLSVVSMARVADQPARLRRALEESMAFQMVLLGAPLGGVALVAHWAVPLLFGAAWLPTVAVYSVLALSRVVTSPNLMVMALLVTRGDNGRLAAVNAVATAVFFAVTLVAVPAVGPVGIGFGLLAAGAARFPLHLYARGLVAPAYGPSARWAVAFVPMTLAPIAGGMAGFLLALPAIAVALLPGTSRQVRGYVALFLDRNSS
ncbi:MAG: oligosaccharide flippase family protein [Acidimicrobiales bacterium]